MGSGIVLDGPLPRSPRIARARRRCSPRSPPTATPRTRSYALYFTLAFGVGSLWTWVFYGRSSSSSLGELVGVAVVFWLMAGAIPHRRPWPRRRSGPSDAGRGGRPAPPADLASPADQAARTAAERSLTLGHTGSGVDARILLVEDDPSIWEVTVIGLRNAGFTVRPPTTAARGLDRFRAGAVDLVLLDVMMPRLDGLEVARRSAGPRRSRL